MKALNRKILIWACIFFALVTGGYTYLWFYTAGKLEDWIVESFAKLERQGFRASYDRLEVHGFPFKLEARLLNPCLHCSKPRLLNMSGPGFITASISIWDHRRVKIKGDEKISIFLLGNEEEIPLASVDQFQLQGALANDFFQDYSMILYGLQTAILKGQEVHFSSLKDPRDGTLSKINIRVNNLSLTSMINKIPLSSIIQEISLEANMVMPILLDEDPVTLLKAWYDQDGVIDLKRINIVWDEGQLEGNGSLSLDQNLQPLAAFAVKVSGIDSLLDGMVRQRMIKKHLLPVLKIALSVLLEYKENKKDQLYNIPISLQDNELSIAAISVYKFDLINWGEVKF